MRRLSITALSIAHMLLGTGCLPHLMAPSPTSPRSRNGEFSTTALGLVPTSDTAPARPGLVAEGVFPASEAGRSEARTIWVIRAAAVPGLWSFASGSTLVPTMDTRIGVRRLLLADGPLRLGVEVGGMATLWPLGVIVAGADGYVGAHVSFALHDLELFLSGELCGGALFILPLGRQAATTVQLGGGISLRTRPFRAAFVGGVFRHWQESVPFFGAGPVPVSQVVLGPFIGLQLAFDVPRP